MKRRRIIAPLLSAILFAGQGLVRADDGLEFLAHTVQPEHRTSLVLDGGKPFRMKDGLRLDFDLLLRNEEHNFGYICRLIVNDTLNVDVLSNAGWGSDQLSVIVGNRACLSISDIGSVPDFAFGKWMPVSLTLDVSSGQIALGMGEMQTAGETELPAMKNVRVVFGLSDDRHFPTTDCPPMSLRNVELSSLDSSPAYRWALSEHGEGYVLDEFHGRRAIVRNPVWETDRHMRWTEVSHLRITGNRPQIAAFEGKDSMGIYVATGDSLYYVPLRGDRPSAAIGYAGGRPYNSTSNSLIYLPETDGLVSYSVTEDRLDSFDFTSRKWNSDSPELKFSHLHHNEILLPGGDTVVVFGGYDEYTYYADLSMRSFGDRGWTRLDLSSQISPRYLSAAAYSGDGRIFVLGGYGSRTGKQTESPQFFNDFNAIDLSTGAVERKWTFDNGENEVFGNSMILDDDGRTLYALSFRSDRNNTLLRLNSFDVETGERKIFPGTIPYGFHDTDSWCTLLRDKEAGRLLTVVSNTSRTGGTDIAVWSMDWKPYLPEDVIQQERRSPLSLITVLAAFLSAIAVGIAVVLVSRRRRRSQISVKNEQPEECSSVETYVSESVTSSFREPTSDSLNLIGPFRWTGHDGDDRTAKFSVTLRNIFLYIIIHRCVTGSGVASRILDEVFWNSEPSEASNRRNVAMSRLRKLLAAENIGELCYRSGVWEVVLNESVFCDLVRLDDLLPAKDWTPLPERSALDEILVICRRGSMLSGIEDEWCDRFKSWYMLRISGFLERVLGSPETKSDPQLSIEIAEVLLANDPIDELAIGIKCRSLFATGRKGQAKASFEAFMNEYEKMLGEPSRLNFQEIIKM